MSERTSVTQVTQIGAESSKGTAVAALKILQATSIEPAIKPAIGSFRPFGQKFPTLAVFGREWTEAKITGVLSYSDLVYLLSSLLAYAAPVRQESTAAYKWTHTPAQSAEDTVKTYTVEHGSLVRAGRFDYGIVNSLSMEFDRRNDTIPIDGSMLGQAYEDSEQLSTNEQVSLIKDGTVTGGTFTLSFGAQTTAAIAYNATAAAVQAALELLSTIGSGNVYCTGGPCPSTAVVIEFRYDLAQTDVGAITVGNGSITGGGTMTVTVSTAGVAPSAVAAVPVSPSDVDIYLDDAYDELGDTKLTRAFRANLSISERFGPMWTINSAVSGFAEAVELAPKGEFTLLVEADSTGMGLLTPMRAGDKRFIRVIAIGEVIESTYYYTAQFDFCGTIIDVKEFSDEDGVYAIEYTFQLTYDSDLTYAISAEVTNELTTL